MVEFLNFHTSNTHCVNSLRIEEEAKKSDSASHRMKEVFDQMVGQISPYLLNPAILEECEGNMTLSFRIKGFEETFSYSTKEISETDQLCSAFNQDIAHAMVSRLLEKGGELTLSADSDVTHTKNQVAVKMPIKGYISQGVFDLKGFIAKALAALTQKNQAVARGIEGYALPLNLKKKYPQELNLTYWLDNLYLRCSEHPDLFSMEDVLRRNIMNKP